MRDPAIELTLHIGQYGERSETVALPISQSLMRELREPLEWSDEPFSLMLASPGMWGGKGNAVEQRRRIFKLRQDHANGIAKLIADELMRMFGTNDRKDGYAR